MDRSLTLKIFDKWYSEFSDQSRICLSLVAVIIWGLPSNTSQVRVIISCPVPILLDHTSLNSVILSGCCLHIMRYLRPVPMQRLSRTSSFLVSQAKHVTGSWGFHIWLAFIAWTHLFKSQIHNPSIPMSSQCIQTCSKWYSDKQNCYNVWYFCSVHNVVCACVGILLSIGETMWGINTWLHSGPWTMWFGPECGKVCPF